MREYVSGTFKVTNVGKLRSMQYRILNNALVFNKQLFLWKIKDSDVCSNCQEKTEDLMHFFVECEYAKKLWKEVQVYILERYNETIVINAENIIFNIFHSYKLHLTNYICLVVKSVMYSHRCGGKKLNIQTIQNLIEKYRIYELYEAKKLNKVSMYIKKWETQNQDNQKQVQNRMYIEQYLTALNEG